MVANSIAKERKKAAQAPYNPTSFIERVNELLKSHNESYREASLRARLDHQAVRRILSGQRPQMHICILLADHFGVNPNEFLQLAGWPTLAAFEKGSIAEQSLPPEVVEVALTLAKIEKTTMRKQIAEAILVLVKKYFEE